MTYGSDFAGVDDFDAFMTILEGEDETLALMQALARRVTTQRYALFYAPTYGTDLRSYIADIEDSTIVAGALGIECRKDPRVADAKATIVVNGSGADVSWVVSIVVTPQEGPTFTLTLAIDDVSIEILTEGSN
jgi:hypothetical protein